MEKVIAVFGYNNSRSYDVKMMKQYFSEKKNTKLLLVKNEITEADRAVSDFQLVAEIERLEAVPEILNSLKEQHFEVVGVLPFSDKGVVAGAAVAEALGLFHDSVSEAPAMVSKDLFRAREQDYIDAKKYKKPKFKIAYHKQELLDFLSENGRMFVKPRGEGNSRGCMLVASLEDVEIYCQQFAQYLQSGLLLEEDIGGGQEYSFDGVDGKYWLTKKYTTKGSYRIEYQHIIPAPIENYDELLDRCHVFLELDGSRGGAIHHEFFEMSNGDIATVEPNRRPAGLMLWNVAQLAFENFNPYQNWFEKACGKSDVINFENLKKNQFAAIRGVLPKDSGIVRSINMDSIMEICQKQYPGFEVRCLVDKGDSIANSQTDNSSFIFTIIGADSNANRLVEKLEEIESFILRNVEISA